MMCNQMMIISRVIVSRSFGGESQLGNRIPVRDRGACRWKYCSTCVSRHRSVATEPSKPGAFWTRRINPNHLYSFL